MYISLQILHTSLFFVARKAQRRDGVTVMCLYVCK